MKVLQILPELNSGGVEKGTLELGKYLTNQGHESLVVSAGGKLVSQLENEGSRHIKLPVHRKSLSSLGQVKVLRQLFLEEKPDIIHVRSRVPAWITWLAWRKMDPKARPHLVSTVHGFNSVSFYSRIMTCGEKVICVSHCVKDYILKNYPKTDESKIVVIHRGVSLEELPHGYQPSADWLEKWSQEFPQTVGKKILTLPGRITRLKGHGDLYEILKRLDRPDIHALIVGGHQPKKQSYYDEIRKKVADLGLEDQVTFTGPRSDIKDIFAISDIVLSLSTQPESFGRTTLEALSIGTPVVGYNHGGVGEQLDELLPEGAIPVGDSQAAEATIRQFLDNPPALLETHPFLLSSTLENTLKLYQSLA